MDQVMHSNEPYVSIGNDMQDNGVHHQCSPIHVPTQLTPGQLCSLDTELHRCTSIRHG